MPPRLTNTRKHRGHVSASYGRIGKHCKHPGDRGLAGGQVRGHRALIQDSAPSLDCDGALCIVENALADILKHHHRANMD